MNWILLILAIIGGVLYPVYGALTAKKTQAYFEAFKDNKAVLYKQIIAFQWIIVIPILITLWVNELPWKTLGLGFIEEIKWVITLMGSIGLAFWIMQIIPLPPRMVERLKKQYEQVDFVIPKNKRDFQWMIGLSLTAGFCEEIIYRGLLLDQLEQVMPTLPGIILANLFFALGHMGTKLKNMLWSLALGLAWSAIYYFTGSLWIPIFTHVAIDMWSGTQSYRLSKLEEAEAEEVAE